MALEQFTGFDQGEGMSESAFEAFKEKMKAAAAQIAAIKKEETKQKKKEEDLLKILLKFVKSSSKKELVLLISRVLEQNIPANFILAIIVFGNDEIKKEVGSFIMLEKGSVPGDNSGSAQNPDSAAPADRKGDDSGSAQNPAFPSSPIINSNTETHSSDPSTALIFFKANDETMPLKVKIELDHWLKNMLFQAEESPQKLLKNSYDIEMIELEREYSFEEPKYEEKRSIKKVIVQLITFVLKEFLAENKMDEPYEKLYGFAGFIIKGILEKIHESLEGRKLLK